VGDAAVAKQQQVTSKPDQSGSTRTLARPAVLAFLLIVFVVALYYPVHGHPFINYDDPDYVSENTHVTSGLSVATVEWAFTTGYASNWHPLTWVSHALDCQLFGVNPGPQHMTNVLIHALNAALLFWVLFQATGCVGRSFMVAALFALHPVNVESVAWIAERKTVLSTFFCLLAICAYTAYARRPGVLRYIIVAAFFVCGLMAKPQIIILPCLLLLWDYWPLGRTPLNAADASPAGTDGPVLPRRSLLFLVLEKIPLFVLSAGSAVVTMLVQRGARHGYPRILRVGNAILSYALYIKNALLPTRLALLYPHPITSLAWSHVFLAGVVLLVITLLVLIGWRQGYLPMGWLWFLGSLVPMLGIVQVGVQAMADRYAYVAYIGLFIMICWGLADLSQKMRLTKVAAPVICGTVLLALTAVARNQINYWSKPSTMWQHTVAVTAQNWVAQRQWGDALLHEGQRQEAFVHFHKAIAVAPDDTACNMALSVEDLLNGNYASVISRLQIVLKDKTLGPAEKRQAYVEMAKAYWELGDKTKSRVALQAGKQVVAQ